MTTTAFLDDLPRFAFFTGKGGVGKTSLACAGAVRLAEAGRRVLLVSTDPASNVGQVFSTTVGDTVTPIAQVPGLAALEIDPEQAAEAHRRAILDPLRDVLPADEVATLTEQLSGACTTEIASFNEFAALLADGALTAGADHVLFDTAPTGHTIRLLRLPGEWTRYLSDGKGDVSCLGPVAGLDRLRHDYAGAVAALTDARRTRLVLVTRPQRSSLAEAARTWAELRDLGMGDAHLVVNGRLPSGAGPDPLADAVERRERDALRAIPPALATLPRTTVPLLPVDTVGVPALRALLAPATPATPPAADGALVAGPSAPGPALPEGVTGLGELVDDLEADGPALVMCMGKGGVGKTTVAAAVALELARRGHEVLLTTTDPAAHLADTLPADVEHLTLSRIDPAAAVAEYRARVMAGKGAGLDDAARAALAEDLRSPCTDEVAVFQQFSHVVLRSRRQYVVLDTAPTGHTLLLLDATGSYHREVSRQMAPGVRFTTPLMRLQDPRRTKVLLVTLAETTPVLEAAGLQDDLARAGIRPYAWVVNGSLAAARPASPFLRARARAEGPSLDRVRGMCRRVVVLPLLVDEPVGAPRLASPVRWRADAPAGARDEGAAQVPERVREQVREHVRDHYARAAVALSAPGAAAPAGSDASGCCAPPGEATPGSCCTGRAGRGQAFGAARYAPEVLADLPVTAVPASLGCGNPMLVAGLREGETVLDLGSGAGLDCLLAARRVGEHGFVHGVDMTDEMLDLARRNAAAAGVRNVDFVKGVIEHLPLPDAAVDAVISNCVINLSADKPAVLSEMYRVLRPGGRIGVSDVVAEDDLSPADRAERGSFAGCVAGALTRREYLDGLAAAGFVDARVIFTHTVADGIHGALVQAVKPAA